MQSSVILLQSDIEPLHDRKQHIAIIDEVGCLAVQTL